MMPTKDKTKRVLDISAKVETREAQDGKRFIDGVLPYNSRSEVLWDFVEVIAPGAFSKTLNDGADIKCFWGHDETDILGTRKNGTLVLNDQPDGLHFSVELRDTEIAKDHFEAVKRGDVTGVSFGFIATREEWDETQDPAVRTLKEMRLLEISPGVAFAAYPGAYSSAALRSLVAESGVDIAAALAARNKPTAADSPESDPAPPETAPEARARAEAEAEDIATRDELDLIEALAGFPA
jgi:HK97 family phage prohead protease